MLGLGLLHGGASGLGSRQGSTGFGLIRCRYLGSRGPGLTWEPNAP